MPWWFWILALALVLVVPTGWKVYVLAGALFLWLERVVLTALADLAAVRKSVEMRLYPWYPSEEMAKTIERVKESAAALESRRDAFYSSSSDGRTLTSEETEARVREGQDLNTQYLEHLADVHRLDDAIRLNALVCSGQMSRRRAAAKYYKRSTGMRVLRWSLRGIARRSKQQET